MRVAEDMCVGCGRKTGENTIEKRDQVFTSGSSRVV